MKAYCWLATIICLIGTAINIFRIDWCFCFWIVGEIMWVFYDTKQKLMSRTILDLIGLLMAVIGAWENLIRHTI